MISENRLITPRRTLEQIKHCIEEAISVWENKEDVRCAWDDLLQAQKLIDAVIKDPIYSMAKGYDRGSDLDNSDKFKKK